MGEALLFKVYAAFGDTRLPAAYRGDDSWLNETNVFDTIAERYGDLTDEDRAALDPFMRRPEDPASDIGAPAEALPGRNGGGITRDNAHCGTLKSGWSFEADPLGHVKVWYRTANTADQPDALILKDYIETTVWPKLFTSLGLKPPLNDESLVGCDGGDGKLDIYLVDMQAWGDYASNRGETHAGWCKGASGFILLNRNLVGNDLKSAAIHEIVHASQWAYNTASCHSTYGWFNDATANWGVDYVDASLQLEQQYADCVTRSPEKGLEDRSKGSCSRNVQWNRDYGSYLFFQFMAHTMSPARVKAAFDHTESMGSSLDAVNAALTRGFKDDWLEYAKALYNDAPVDTKTDSLKGWDSLTDRADKKSNTSANISSFQEKTELEGEIANLSAQYYRFTFTDASARSVLFRNTWIEQHLDGKAIGVYAYWKDASGTWHDEDWSSYEFVGFCRDYASQRVMELVVVVANGEYRPNGGGQLTVAEKPYLKRNKVGCWKFQGTTHVDINHETWSGVGIDIDSQIAFESPAGMLSLGFEHPQIPKSRRIGASYLMSLSGTSYSMVVDYTQNACNYRGGPVSFNVDGSDYGFLMVSPFDEIKVNDATLQEFINHPAGTYAGSAAAMPMAKKVVATVSGGDGCTGTVDEPVASYLLTNDANNGHMISPPQIKANGKMIDSYNVVEDFAQMQWDLAPQSQP